MIVGSRLAIGKTDDYVICGNGNFIEIRELKSGNFEVVKRVQVFKTTIICGIHCLQNGGVLCYGDRKLTILDNDFQVVTKLNMHSWISAASSLNDGTIIVLTASSILCKINGSNFSIEERIQLESFGVLISGFIQGNNWENLTVFVGVFDYIKLFRPFNSTKAVKTFVGHTGMIFAFAQLDNILYSISDDRSLRAWDIENGNEIASVFGHTSRPFAIEVSKEVGILTAGADQFVCVWQLNGNQIDLMKRTTFDGGPIRSLRLIDNNLLVGSDTGFLFSLQLDALNSNVELAVSLDDKRINSFLHYGEHQFVVLADNRELWINKNDEWTLLNKELHYRPNLLLKVPKSDYFIAPTVTSIFIYDFTKQKLIYQLDLDYNLCFTFWLDNYLFASNEKHECLIYEFLDETLTYRSKFDLKNSQNFIASGCFYNDLIFVGTTRGTLLVLDRSDFKVVKVFPKLHKKFLICDIKLVDGKLITIGKDGKFNLWEITEDITLNLLFTSSAIEWPSKLLLDSSGTLKFIAGFSGNKCMIVNAQNFLIDFQVLCGGGHRVWDYDLNEYQLRFVSNSKIYSIQTRGLTVKCLEGSWHQSEFTSMDIFNCSSSKSLIFTGGNDTQIAMSEYDPSSDKIVLKFKNKYHNGSIHDLAIFDDFLISVGGCAEFNLWKISTTALYALDKQKLEFDARILSVDAQLFDNFLMIAAISSYGSIKLFKYTLDGQLVKVSTVDLSGVSSCTKLCFVNSNCLTATTTNGHLICYSIANDIQLAEKTRIFVEKNSLSALKVKENIAIVGSVSGQISAVNLDNFGVTSILAHGSTITDIDLNCASNKLEIFSVSLDRCLVVSEFDQSTNELRILKTLAHCIYDPSRVRLLLSNTKERKCIISGYGLETVSV